MYKTLAPNVNVTLLLNIRRVILSSIQLQGSSAGTLNTRDEFCGFSSKKMKFWITHIETLFINVWAIFYLKCTSLSTLFLFKYSTLSKYLKI